MKSNASEALRMGRIEIDLFRSILLAVNVESVGLDNFRETVR